MASAAFFLSSIEDKHSMRVHPPEQADFGAASPLVTTRIENMDGVEVGHSIYSLVVFNS